MNLAQDEEVVKAINTIASALTEIQKTLKSIDERLKGLITAQYDLSNKR